MEIVVSRGSRKKNRAGKRKSRYWILSALSTGAIIAFTIGSSHHMVVGYAEQRNGKFEMTSPRREMSDPIDFDIPAGLLGKVLEAFQKRTGLIVEVENENIRAIESPGVMGNYTVEAALRQILKGTGVSYSFRDARTVLLSIKAEV